MGLCFSPTRAFRNTNLEFADNSLRESFSDMYVCERSEARLLRIYMHAGESFAADEKSLLRIYFIRRNGTRAHGTGAGHRTPEQSASHSFNQKASFNQKRLSIVHIFKFLMQTPKYKFKLTIKINYLVFKGPRYPHLAKMSKYTHSCRLNSSANYKRTLFY
jgi:hypothetical protein